MVARKAARAGDGLNEITSYMFCTDQVWTTPGKEKCKLNFLIAYYNVACVHAVCVCVRLGRGYGEVEEEKREIWLCYLTSYYRGW